MRKILSLAVAASLIAAANAQSCSGSAPAGSLATINAGGVFAGSPSATVGANMFFDLATNADVSITGLGVKVYDDGSVVANPNLLGGSAPFQVWICPITWSGNQNIQANWTLLGTGTLTVAASGGLSPVVFGSPLTLTAGNYGIALTHLPMVNGAGTPSGTAVGPIHPLYTNPASTPGTATVYSDQYMTLTAGVVQQTAWTGGVGGVRVINTRIDYQPGVNAGYTLQYGTGCYFRPQSWYEYQAGGATATNWDLSNSSITAINNGNSYTVVPGGLPYTVPTSAALTTVGLTLDDDITAPQTLPFTFPFPGGSTTQIIVSTNGHVFLGTSTATFGPYTFNAFFTDVPRIACAWSDWDLTSQGSMHYDIDPSNQFVTVTWNNINEWAAAGSFGSNSFQLVLYASGQIDYIWQNVAHTAPPLAVGFSRGNGTGDPGSVDISASFPLNTGDGSVPPVLSMNPRPKVGTTPAFITSNIAPGTFFSLIAFSFVPAPGIPLGFLGMPGCFQNVGLPATTGFGPVIAGTYTVPLGIPNDPSYNGVNLFAQTAPLTGGLNTAGVLTSNGLCVHIGLQ